MLAIAQGLNAVKALTDIAKTMLGLRDSAKLLETNVEFNQQILSVQKALLDAQAEQTDLIKTIRDREEEIARLKAWDTEKNTYDLKNIGRAYFAYMLKHGARAGAPPHLVCAHCYKQRQISILQYAASTENRRGGLMCPACKNYVSPTPDIFDRGQPRWLD